MNDVLDFFMDGIGGYINAIRSEAANHGGICTWRFSQAKAPVRGIITMHKDSRKGICRVLSDRWLTLKARGGESMQLWLAAPDGHRSHIDQAKIAQLCQGFGVARDEQETTSERWMRAMDMHRCAGTNDGGTHTRPDASFDPDTELLGDLEKRSRRHPLPLSGCISFGSTKIGHATAIYVSTNPGTGRVQVDYFDPNYGEFHFNTWDGFRGWFLYAFDKAYCRFGPVGRALGSRLGCFYRVRYFEYRPRP